MAFPHNECWYLIEHDELIEKASYHTNWLNTASWRVKSIYNSKRPNRKLLQSLIDYKL